jgi:hypothetical protein
MWSNQLPASPSRLLLVLLEAGEGLAYARDFLPS